jgi:putative Holliday junction resolvase
MSATYLAFDYGSKRIGLAVGNDLLCTTQALPAINTKQLRRADGKIILDTVQDIVNTWKINHLIFGAPLGTNAQETALSKRIKRIGHQLGNALALPVSFADERYSSSEADRLLREHHQAGKQFNTRKIALRDSIAAQLILQAYFSDNLNNRSPARE